LSAAGPDRTSSRARTSADGSRKLFVNLPVLDVNRSVAFFKQLGFRFDAELTDDRAACMIVNADTRVMLLRKEFFTTFTKRQLCDAGSHAGSLFALSCGYREEVDELVGKAIAAGGTYALEPVERRFVYAWSFYDLDGHQWDVVWRKDPRTHSWEEEEVLRRLAQLGIQ
jgi:uncharacterized protein